MKRADLIHNLLAAHAGGSCLPYMSTNAFGVSAANVTIGGDLTILLCNGGDGLGDHGGNAPNGNLFGTLCFSFLNIRAEIRSNKADLCPSAQLIRCRFSTWADQSTSKADAVAMQRPPFTSLQSSNSSEELRAPSHCRLVEAPFRSKVRQRRCVNSTLALADCVILCSVPHG